MSQNAYYYQYYPNSFYYQFDPSTGYYNIISNSKNDITIQNEIVLVENKKINKNGNNKTEQDNPKVHDKISATSSKSQGLSQIKKNLETIDLNLSIQKYADNNNTKIPKNSYEEKYDEQAYEKEQNQVNYESKNEQNHEIQNEKSETIQFEKKEAIKTQKKENIMTEIVDDKSLSITFDFDGFYKTLYYTSLKYSFEILVNEIKENYFDKHYGSLKKKDDTDFFEKNFPALFKV